MTKKRWAILIILLVLFLLCWSISRVIYQRHLMTNTVVLLSPPVSEQSTSMCHQSVVTILSIDGGGVRGIIPAVLLQKLEQSTQKPIATLFDYMTGVSTGSIVIGLLTTPNKAGQPKYTTTDVIDMYENSAPLVFQSHLLHNISTFYGLIGPKFDPEGMQQLSHHYFENVEMRNLLSNVSFYAYDVQKKGLMAFTNHPSVYEVNMPYYKIRDVVDGATAIMAYFPSKSLFDSKSNVKHIVADASFALNNPTSMAFIDAEEQCPNAEHYVVISLGTGRLPTINVNPKSWGLIRWLPAMLETTVAGETLTADITMNKFVQVMNNHPTNDGLPRVLFIRLNPDLSFSEDNPIDVSAQHLKDLKSIAVHYAQNNQALFHCLDPILKTHSLQQVSKQCIDLLQKKRESMPTY